MKSIVLVATLCVVIAAGASGQFIYSNGPLITHPGTAFGGNDGSALDVTAPLPNLNILGFSVNGAAGFRMADEFTIPCGEVWTLNSIKVFAYQTGSGTAVPSLNGGNYKIWAQAPNSPGATVLFDYSATNQMTGVAFPAPLLYRVTTTTVATANTRPVQALTMTGNSILLIPGTYWLDWAVTGSLASGPFAPPISIIGTPASGNALQGNGATWTALTDGLGGTIYPQGMPFDIDHSTQFVGCFQLNITQAGPGGNVTLANTGGIPGFTALNAVTLNAGAFPNDWFFGVGISLPELGGILGGGVPFLLTLPPSGTYSITVGYSLGVSIPVYYVGLMISGNQLITADVPKTITLM